MKRISILLVATVLTGVGCESVYDRPMDPQMLQQQQALAHSAYRQYQTDYQQWASTIADANALSPYSPSLYQDLLLSWDDAKFAYDPIADDPSLSTQKTSLFGSMTYGEHFEQTLDDVDKIYQQLQNIKTQADEVLADASAQIEYLQSLNAATLVPSDYNALYDDYLELFEYIADKQINYAKNQQVIFLSKAKLVEINAVLAHYITPLQTQLETFVTRGDDFLAPHSFARAQAEINLASNILRGNTRDSELIEQAVSKAQFELAHAHNISSEVKLLSSDKEQLVLNFEEKLQAINMALNQPDTRDNPMQVQTQLIVEQVAILQAPNKEAALQAEIDTLKKQIATLTTQQVDPSVTESNNKDSDVKAAAAIPALLPKTEMNQPVQQPVNTLSATTTALKEDPSAATIPNAVKVAPTSSAVPIVIEGSEAIKAVPIDVTPTEAPSIQATPTSVPETILNAPTIKTPAVNQVPTIELQTAPTVAVIPEVVMQSNEKAPAANISAVTSPVDVVSNDEAQSVQQAVDSASSPATPVAVTALLTEQIIAEPVLDKAMTPTAPAEKALSVPIEAKVQP